MDEFVLHISYDARPATLARRSNVCGYACVHTIVLLRQPKIHDVDSRFFGTRHQIPLSNVLTSLTTTSIINN